MRSANGVFKSRNEAHSFCVENKVAFWRQEPVLFGKSERLGGWEWIAAWGMTELDQCGPYDRLCPALFSCVVCLCHHIEHMFWIQNTFVWTLGKKKKISLQHSFHQQQSKNYRITTLSCYVMFIIIIRSVCFCEAILFCGTLKRLLKQQLKTVCRCLCSFSLKSGTFQCNWLGSWPWHCWKNVKV